MKKILILIVSCTTALVTGCSWFPAYKLEIQQGNIIRQSDLNQVRLGMTQHQIRYILGTPVIQDPFHDNRWDYVYTLKQGGEKIEQKNVILYFDNEKLARIEGTVLPDPNAKKDLSELDKQTVITVNPQQKEKRSLWKRILLGDDEEDN